MPVVVQDDDSGAVLMLAYMNEEAWRLTLETGKATYWSRSRNTLWIKGETSGHVQMVRAIFVDCDGDTVLLRVRQAGGAACHTGHATCFYRQWRSDGLVTVGAPLFNPEDVYKR